MHNPFRGRAFDRDDYFLRRYRAFPVTYLLPDYSGDYYYYDGYYFDDYGYYGFWGCLAYSNSDSAHYGATAYDQDYDTAYNQGSYNCSYYYGDCTTTCQFWNYQ